MEHLPGDVAAGAAEHRPGDVRRLTEASEWDLTDRFRLVDVAMEPSIGARIGPRATALAKTPEAPNSIARDLIKPSVPAFAAA